MNKDMVIIFDRNKNIDATQLFLLKNNTFLKHEASFGNNEYKILTYVFAKIQKQLIDDFGKPHKELFETVGNYLSCKIGIEELHKLNIAAADLCGARLRNILNKILGATVNYVSYINGNYIMTHLVDKFELVSEDMSIHVALKKDVFLMIWDYNLDIDFKANYPLLTAEYERENKEFIKIEPKKNHLNKGYSKIKISTISDFKSYYTQIMFHHLKVALEQKRISLANAETVDYKITISEFRRIFKLETKYRDFYDLNKKVITTFINELKLTNYFDITVERHYKNVVGGKCVEAITLSATALFKTLELLEENQKSAVIDVNYEDVYGKDSTTCTLEQSLAYELADKANIKLAVNTFKALLKEYGEDIVKEAKNILIRQKNIEGKKIKAPKQYIIGVCNNLKARQEVAVEEEQSSFGNYISNNKNRIRKNASLKDITTRGTTEEEFKRLEEQLLGWYTVD